MAVHSTAQLLFYLKITILKGHHHPGTYDACIVYSYSRVKTNPIFMALDFKSQGDFTERD